MTAISLCSVEKKQHVAFVATRIHLKLSLGEKISRNKYSIYGTDSIVETITMNKIKWKLGCFTAEKVVETYLLGRNC